MAAQLVPPVGGGDFGQYVHQEIAQDQQTQGLRNRHNAIQEHIEETEDNIEAKERVIQDITFFDDSRIGEARRVHRFVSENRDVLLNVPVSIFIRAAAGAAVGACAGYVISLVYTPAAFIAIPGGAVLGGALGTVWGVKVSLPPIKIRYNETFRRVQEQLYQSPGVDQLLDEVPDLRDFEDYFTKSLILVPMRDNFGDVYEEASIREWLRRHPDGNNSPLRKGHITHLEFDLRFRSRLMDAFKNIAAEKQQEAQRVLDQYLAAVQPIRDALLDRISVVATRCGLERGMPIQEIARNVEQIQREFGL